MKKCCVILLLLIFVFCLSSCSNTQEKKLVHGEWVECGEIERFGENLVVYYDTKTKVMYAHGYNSLTVLLNADGTPMLYEEKE